MKRKHAGGIETTMYNVKVQQQFGKTEKVTKFLVKTAEERESKKKEF